MQGVHESKGVSGDYLRLESLIQKVVSPYLGTHGLYSRDGSSNLHCSSCLLGMFEVMYDGSAFKGYRWCDLVHLYALEYALQNSKAIFFSSHSLSQKSVCSAPGPPNQATPRSPRTQWYAPRATMFPCWPLWWSMTLTPPQEVARVSDGTLSLRWRPAWRRAAPWLNPQLLPPTTPAHPASPTTPQPLLHFQVGLHW